MKNIEKYYTNTESEMPRNNIKYFINKIQCDPSNAIELGCGAGNDTVYLIKNNWNVLAIDREDVEERISKRLTKRELKKFKFSQQNFETIELEKTYLIVANFSLPFCKKEKFENLWNKIKSNIYPNGYFVGNFFGINDEWNKNKSGIIFHKKKEIIKLFSDFDIVKFKEIEKDMLTGMGKNKHWHIFDVIAKKK